MRKPWIPTLLRNSRVTGYVDDYSSWRTGVSSNPGAGADLVTVGYGKSKLKDPSNPFAEVNRRVQVVNMENKATASK
jgi:flagellar motor protein MotB